MSYTETDLVTRWLDYADLETLRLPDEPRSLPEISDLDLDEAEIAAARQAGLPVDTLLATQDAIRRFLEQPRSLEWKVEAREGLPLSLFMSDPVSLMKQIEGTDGVTVRVEANGS